MVETRIQTDRDGVRAQQGASTPFRFSASVDPATLAALEYHVALDLVADFAAGPLGAARLKARRPVSDPLTIVADLEPVAELLSVMGRGEKIDIPPVPDASQVFPRAKLAGAVLSGVELAAIKQTLSAARIAVAELGRIAAEAPNAARLMVRLPDRKIDQRLIESISDEGEVLDSASPELMRARLEIHASRNRLIKKLESILRSADSQAIPAGAQVTIRGDRYVIPIRRDARHRPEGPIHDESASQGTLFVEPTGAIELGNAHRTAIADADREELRVLRALTELLRPEIPLLEAAHEMCVAGDDLMARARYAHAVGCHVPSFGESLVIRQGRHPILLARGIDVVPFDLELVSPQKTLLISGPNAGGKTVLIKAVGLAALLSQAGIVPPVGPGTSLPIFSAVFADIGDHQSIAADLSTFSAHLTVLTEILSQADSETLVLIDEIGSGTDPIEGGALAAAALRALTRRGVTTIASTHLGSLKTLASDEPGVVNGSLQFDADQLRPTFRFQMGVPGRSYGLAIAKRLGLDPAVVAEAEGRVPVGERSLDELLAVVEARARDQEARETDLLAREGNLAARETIVAERNRDQEEREKALKRREREAERMARAEARRHLLEARATVEAALKEATGAGDPERAKGVRRRLEEAIAIEQEAIAAAEIAETPPPSQEPIAVGQRVRMTNGGVGMVVQERSDGKLVVALGALKMVVAASDLIPVAGPPPRPSREAPQPEYAPPVGPTEIDLRGLRGDEAEQATAAALDAAILADQAFLRIIHGMGTGVVRDRVRRILSGDRRVKSYEFAPPAQGGTGVTIAWFGDR